MKKLHLFFFAVLLTATTFAQTPEKMSYQAVVRDSGDALVTNQLVGMQISILQTTASGTAVYVETQTPTTNVNGLVTLEIGTGNVVNGDFATIDWSADSYFIKTETDPTGGNSYTITGTSQLLSVPYALHAKTAENVTNSALKFNTTSGSGIQSETNVASGTYSTATGFQTTASGYASLATGFQTTASGKESTAMGLLTMASGDYSTAIGTGLNASEYYSTAIGKHNATMVANTAFVIGNGSSSSALSNAVTVLFNGTTTIAGPVTATSFSGDGSGLTNLPTELEIVGSSDPRLSTMGSWIPASSWGFNSLSNEAMYTNCTNVNTNCSSDYLELSLTSNTYKSVLMSNLDWTNSGFYDVEISYDDGNTFNYSGTVETNKTNVSSTNISNIKVIASNLPTGIDIVVRVIATDGRLHFEGFGLSKQILGSDLKFISEPKISNNMVYSTSQFSTISNVYTGMSDMTTTPVAGTYMVSFSASGNASDASSDTFYSIFNDGILVSDSEREIFSNGGSALDSVNLSLHSQSIVTVNGSQTIDVRVKTTSGIFTVNSRNLVLLRLN